MRVAIADDHALFRQGLKSLLRLQPDVTVVAELERADALLSTLEQTPCDILLLDLQMERSAFVDIEVLAERVAIVRHRDGAGGGCPRRFARGCARSGLQTLRH